MGQLQQLAAYDLSEDDVREAVRPLAAEGYSAADLLAILHAAA